MRLSSNWILAQAQVAALNAKPGEKPTPAGTTKKLSPEEIAATITAWRSVVEYMNDFEGLLNIGDELSNSWTFLMQTDSSRAISEAAGLAQNIYNFRIKLESLHDSYAGVYPDISDKLNIAVRSGGRAPVPGTLFDQLVRATSNFSDGLKPAFAERHLRAANHHGSNRKCFAVCFSFRTSVDREP